MANATIAPKNGAQKTKTAQTNAPVINAPAFKVETTESKTEPKSAALPGAPVKTARTLEEVTREIQERFQLLEKRDKLIATLSRLEFFKLGSTGMKDRLTIGDGNHEFWTEYTPLVQEVHRVCIEFIVIKLDEIEKEILS